jgi:hypothetical protein
MNPISYSLIRNHRQIVIAVVAASTLLVYAFPVSDLVMMNNTAEDLAGNSAEESFTITVQDIGYYFA